MASYLIKSYSLSQKPCINPNKKELPTRAAFLNEMAKDIHVWPTSLFLAFKPCMVSAPLFCEAKLARRIVRQFINNIK